MTWVRKGLPPAEKPHACPLPGAWRRLFAGARTGARWRCGYWGGPDGEPNRWRRGCGRLWEFERGDRWYTSGWTEVDRSGREEG